MQSTYTMMTKRHLHEFRQIMSYLDQEIGGINQPLLAIALLITLVDLSFQVSLRIFFFLSSYKKGREWEGRPATDHYLTLHVFFFILLFSEYKKGKGMGGKAGGRSLSDI